VVGRPLQLVFQRNTEKGKVGTGADLEHKVEEGKLGCAIEHLKYTVPLAKTPLGATFWKCRQGVVLCDIDADSILGAPEMTKEGVRPGLLLKEIISADGFTRQMNTDMTYLQIMKQIQIVQRPFTAVFEPKVVPLE